jgi:poly-gamma-glutamate capsule biosynthesis protein CapA/YwtB (metallophosphatase superfamily)
LPEGSGLDARASIQAYRFNRFNIRSDRNLMPSTNPVRQDTVHLMFGGDVMLGRIVNQHIERYGPGYPLGPVAPLMRSADLTVVNLECAITSATGHWTGAPKAFYFGASPQAVETLAGAGVDLVSLANNHVLDFGTDGLRQTIRILHQHRIQHAGAGVDATAANSAPFVDRKGMRFGMAAFCDHQADFAANAAQPGIAYLDLDDEFAVMATLRQSLEALRQVEVDWPILSLHWGPNMRFRPSLKFRRLAHAAIDMGWKILFGHSAHVFQGIELHRGCPILYAAGDLVDDYRVDPDFRNDHQLLFEIELGASVLRRIVLHPIFIDDCQARPANLAQADYIAGWMTALCQEMGTTVRREGQTLWIAGTA